MFLKTIAIYSGIFIFASTGANALAAGGDVSAGGGVLKCESPSGGFTYELLDLAEGRENLNLSYSETNASAEEIIENTLQRVSAVEPYLGGLIRSAYDRAVKESTSPPAGLTIAPPQDAAIDFLNSDCMLLGGALYRDKENKLYINPRLIGPEGKLTAFNQAALWMHESVYRVLRDVKIKYSLNSIKARELTAYIMSDQGLQIAVLQKSFRIDEQKQWMEQYCGKRVNYEQTYTKRNSLEYALWGREHEVSRTDTSGKSTIECNWKDWTVTINLKDFHAFRANAKPSVFNPSVTLSCSYLYGDLSCRRIIIGDNDSYWKNYTPLTLLTNSENNSFSFELEASILYRNRSDAYFQMANAYELDEPATQLVKILSVH